MKQIILAKVLLLLFTTAFTQTNFKLSEQGQFFALSVKNVTESSQWYQRNLGFEKIKSMVTKDSAAMTELLKSGNIMIEIVQQKNAISKDSLKKQSDFLWYGIFKVGIYVKSIDDVMAQLKLNNTEIMMGPVTDTDNKLKFFMVRDNNRNILQFFETME